MKALFVTMLLVIPVLAQAQAKKQERIRPDTLVTRADMKAFFEEEMRQLDIQIISIRSRLQGRYENAVSMFPDGQDSMWVPKRIFGIGDSTAVTVGSPLTSDKK